MAMTEEQLTTYSADIAANTDPDIVQWVADGNHQAIAEWYNEDATPDVYVFRSSVSRVEMIGSMDWANEYDPGFKDDIEAIMFIAGESYDPRPVESRNALNAVFAGSGTSKAAILTQSVTFASWVQKLFVVATTGPGGGDGSAIGGAALNVFDQDVSVDDTRTAVLMIP